MSAPATPPHIVFHLRNAAYLRHFQPLMLELLGRGHRLTLLLQKDLDRERATLDRLLAHPGVTARAAAARTGPSLDVAQKVRGGIDYLRYLEPGFERAVFLRSRQEARAPRWLVSLGRQGWLAGGRRRALAAAALGIIDRGLPAASAVTEQLRSLAPDLVVVSPLVADADQADVVRAARQLDVPCALLVASWDNLTNKGLIRDLPDGVLLWNADQRREAIDLHKVPSDRITVTGAHTFDPWFTREPYEDRAAFCARLGLDPSRPLVLYLCSSVAIARTEPAWVERWLTFLRASADPTLAGANVLVRPHPASGGAWRDSRLPEQAGVAVWPPVGMMPTDAASQAGFYDSMFHAAAVVGINTSAMIESAIVGRQGFTVLVEEFDGGQEGTLHFSYLRSDAGGPLSVAADLDEHVRQLSAALGGNQPADLRAFVERFVRPLGLSLPAAPIAADQLELLMLEPPPRAPAGRGAPRPLVAAVIALAVVADQARERFGARSPLARRVRRSRRRRAKRRQTGKAPDPFARVARVFRRRA